MGDEHEGLPHLVHKKPEQPQHLRAGLTVEAAGRLVREHHRRSSEHRSPDGHALALPARQLVRQVAQPPDESQGLQHLIEVPAIHFPVRQAQRQQQAIPHVEHGHQVELLKRHADLGAGLAKPRDLPVPQPDLPRGGHLQPRKHVEQRSFPASRRPHHRRPLPLRNRLADVVEGRHRTGAGAVALG